jgi:diguanylate cyclase (GGDEF)-like protein
MNDQIQNPSDSGSKDLPGIIGEETTQDLKTPSFQLDQLIHQNYLLNEMGSFLQGSLWPKEVYEVVRQYGYKLFANQSGRLYILNNAKNLLETAAAWGEAAPEESLIKPEDCWALRLHKMHLVSGVENRLDCPHFKPEDGQEPPAYLCAPLISQGEILGMLHQRLDVGQQLQKWEQLALSLSERISLSLANLKLKETLRLQSIRDPQTNLFSRCYMEETLDRELLRATRHRQPLGIIMLDIDNFKHINSELGYEAGDALLKEMGIYIQSNIRGEDVACRFGPDEFVILFPEVSLGGTKKRAEQICQNARNLKISYHKKLIHPFSISVGVASFPAHAATAVDLLQAVEAGLQQAVKAGRNRVEVVRKVE